MTDDDLNDGVILPSVVYHLKNILEQYPSHGQILYVSRKPFVILV